MSPMRQISLPTEVLDYIFSFLESDSITLKACTESHSFLSQFAERYLYSTINLQEYHSIVSDPRGVFKFNQLLVHTPRIGSCVRTVEVGIDKYHRQDLSLTSSILQKLPLVKKITLCLRAEISWEMLPETFRQAFLKCLGLPSMKELSLRSVHNFPLSALKDSKTIKVLELVLWKMKVPDTVVHPLPSIEFLSINSCDKSLLPWLKKCHIHSLALSNGCGFDVLSDLLACCSNYLTTLDLHVGCLFPSFYNLTTREVRHDHKPFSITLSALIHLEKLTIHGRVHFDCFSPHEWTMTTSIPAIANVLKTSSSLKHVSLVLHCLFITNFRKFPIGLANWGPLVCLLTESSVPSFTLYINTRDEMACTIILTSLANCAELTKLVDKGVLVITPHIPSERKVIVRPRRG